MIILLLILLLISLSPQNCINTLVNQAIQRPNTVITVAAWPVSILSSNGKRGKQGGPNFYTPIPSGKEGIQYQKSGPIDLILGFYGVAYRKRFFYQSPLQIDPLLFSYTKRPEFTTHCTYVDDIWFSGHLERLHIPRYTIGKVEDSKAGVTPLTNVDALSLDQGLSQPLPLNPLVLSPYPIKLSDHFNIINSIIARTSKSNLT